MTLRMLSIITAVALASLGCAAAPSPNENTGDGTVNIERDPCPGQTADIEYGRASYYADSLHGRPTASGEPYDLSKLTAAHKTLPFATEVCVINLSNSRAVVVRINDRGPFVSGRIIDLSRAAARKLDLITAGVTDVEVRVLAQP